jgi:hypothetical protein
MVDGVHGVGDQETGQGQGRPVAPGRRQQQGGADAELERPGVVHEVGAGREAGEVGERAWRQQRPQPGRHGQAPCQGGGGGDVPVAAAGRAGRAGDRSFPPLSDVALGCGHLSLLLDGGLRFRM